MDWIPGKPKEPGTYWTAKLNNVTNQYEVNIATVQEFGNKINKNSKFAHIENYDNCNEYHMVFEKPKPPEVTNKRGRLYG